LTASELGERMIAGTRADGEDLPLRIRGGGGGNRRKGNKKTTDSEEDQVMGTPIRSLRHLDEVDTEDIKDMMSKDEHI